MKGMTASPRRRIRIASNPCFRPDRAVIQPQSSTQGEKRRGKKEKEKERKKRKEKKRKLAISLKREV